VQRLLSEPALRAQLTTAGAVQAAKYSWSRSAAGTLAAIDAGIAAASNR
jgi:hypothetical protein